jgi:hypothetical protein
MTTQILTMFVAVWIPILNGLLTRYTAVRARVYLQLVLNSLNGFAIEWLNAITTQADFNVGDALLGTGLSLLTAIAVQAGVWAPLGMSEKAKSAGVGASAVQR